MTFAQFPHQQLRALGTNVRTLADELGTEKRGAVDVDGLDEQDHQRVRSAVEGFQDEWDPSLEALLDTLGKTGEMSESIATLVHSTDDQLASGIRGNDS